MISKALSSTYAIIRREKSLHNTCYATLIAFLTRMRTIGPGAGGDPQGDGQGLVDAVPGTRSSRGKEKRWSGVIRTSRGAAPRGARGDTPFFSDMEFRNPGLGRVKYYKNKRGKESIDGIAIRASIFIFFRGRVDRGVRGRWGGTKCSEERQKAGSMVRVLGGGGKNEFPRENGSLCALVRADLGLMRGLGRAEYQGKGWGAGVFG